MIIIIIIVVGVVVRERAKGFEKRENKTCKYLFEIFFFFFFFFFNKIYRPDF